ncbi:MAG TPA: (Fe-S)-binding protein [Bdellovibrionota bacterium]|nr:(Fe-S)-binding protein [Bdellovibrionota bacterium]
MASILKTALTPVKWASKQLLNRTLLRFPGGDEHDPQACAFCPEMCRFSCPTAVATGNDAVTPRGMMSLLYKEKRWPGQAAAGGELWPLYGCTGCGRCTEYCVYGMPVADKLFEARKTFKWSDAQHALDVDLDDSTDPVGDLADEWGEEAVARSRREGFLERSGDARGSHTVRVREPKSVHYLKGQGLKADLDWDAGLFHWGSAAAASARERLGTKRWLIAESVWLSRRLDRAADVDHFCGVIERLGATAVRPFHRGRDCIDTGGEGAYRHLFPEAAATMARDFWERDGARADGIIAFSDRAAAHLRSVLGPDVTVIEASSIAGPGPGSVEEGA